MTNAEVLNGHFTVVSLESVMGERAFTKVETGEEVVLLHYLNRELHKYGERLDLLSFEYCDRVMASVMFSFVAKGNRELLQLVTEKGITLANDNNLQPKIFKGTISDIVLDIDAVNPKKYIFRENRADSNNKVVYGGHSSFSYVALMAFILVDLKKKGIEYEKLVIDNRLGYMSSESFDLLPNLIYCGNKPFLRLLEVENNTEENNPIKNTYNVKVWQAYFNMLRTLGYATSLSSIKEKYERLKTNYHVGMPIIIYYRYYSGRSDSPSDRIASVFMGVIRSFDERELRVEILQRYKTRIGTVLEREAAVRNAPQPDLYTVDMEELLKPKTRMETFPLYHIGIDKLIHEEEIFIMPVENNEDITVDLRTTSDGSGRITVDMDTVDFIYTMFEEWGMDYDRLRFINAHYKSGTKPKYELYREFNTIEYIYAGN